MMKDPTVSVVIPTHNRAAYLADAIDSVIQQRYEDLEVIVVDDASTDETAGVLARLDGTVRVLRSEINIERGAARNLGARSARGDIIAFLDSDDLWFSTKLAAQVDLAKRGLASVTGFAFVDSQGNPTGRAHIPPPDASTRLLRENAFLGISSSVVLPFEMFERVGGFPEGRDVQGSEDWLFLVKLAAVTEIVVVEEPLVKVRLHGDNFTSDPASVAGCMWAATSWLERNGFVRGGDSRRLRTRTAGVIARQFAAQGEWREARGWLGRALRQGSLGEGAKAVARTTLSGVRAAVR